MVTLRCKQQAPQKMAPAADFFIRSIKLRSASWTGTKSARARFDSGADDLVDNILVYEKAVEWLIDRNIVAGDGSIVQFNGDKVEVLGYVYLSWFLHEEKLLDDLFWIVKEMERQDVLIGCKGTKECWEYLQSETNPNLCMLTSRTKLSESQGRIWDKDVLLLTE
jgi:hypothetical protein